MNLVQVNQVFRFINQSVRICGTADQPWFCAKDVATILGYTNAQKAIRDIVPEKHRKRYEDLGVNSEFTLSYNQANLIYINEPGLYALIFRSTLKIAEQFRDWMFEDVIPSIRKSGQYTFDQERQLLMNQHKLEIESKEKQLSRLNQQFLEYKQFKDQTDEVYIGSTVTYAKQGLWKIGRSKSSFKRGGQHNTSHAPGDDFHIFKTLKTHDAVGLERLIHHHLEPLRPVKNREFFQVPSWPALIHFADCCADSLRGVMGAANDVILIAAQLTLNDRIDLTDLDLDSYEQRVFLTLEQGQRRATHDITNCSADEIERVVREGLQELNVNGEWNWNDRFTQETQVSWSHLKPYMQRALAIPPKNFKARAAKTAALNALSGTKVVIKQ